MKYLIDLKITHNSYTNLEFYKKYDDFEFIADSDSKAIEYAEHLQHQCEHEQKNNEIELDPNDPCLMACVYRCVDDDLVHVDL